MNPWTMITIKYPIPKAKPVSWKAFGIASAQIRNADIPAMSKSLRPGVTGGILLVSQTYPPYIQNRTMKIRKDWSRLSQDKDACRRADNWVNVNTKTRSKNNSRVVALSSVSAASGL